MINSRLAVCMHSISGAYLVRTHLVAQNFVECVSVEVEALLTTALRLCDAQVISN